MDYNLLSEVKLFCDFNILGRAKPKWRKVRDSNPRAPRRAASFQDWCIQPLYQLSVDCFIGFNEPIQLNFTRCAALSGAIQILKNQ